MSDTDDRFEITAFRDALIDVVKWMRSTEDTVDRILAMPEMQAIKAILLDAYEMDFGKYWNTTVREWVLS